MTLSKTNKRIIKELYMMGMPKDWIYQTMKKDGFSVKRKEVRKYLNHKTMYGKIADKYSYRTKIERVKSQVKHHVIPSGKEEIARHNHNYLVHIGIRLLEQKRIKYTKALQKIIVKDPLLGYQSP